MENTEDIAKFRDFIEEHYHGEIREAVRRKDGSITVDFRLLLKFDQSLCQRLFENTENTLKDFVMGANEFDDVNLDGEAKSDHFIEIRISNLPKRHIIPIRNIRTKHLDKLIVVEGNVKNRSTVRPQITNARFECPSCGNIISILQLEKTFREPTVCGCGRKGKFTLISSEKLDIQYMSVEEPVEDLNEDSVPQRIGVLLKNDLTNPENQSDYLPGKPIRVSGILKEVPILTKGRKTIDVDWILEANYCESLEENLTKTKFTAQEIQEFKELSKDKDLFDKLAGSVAPGIYGHKKVKEAMLLFLVRGVRKQTGDGKTTREYFHVLLMGDPGAAKSQLGNEIELLSWRSRKVVGRGASGPGLTASAEKDEVLGMRVLQAGALPLCNEGHVVVDEVDKMEKDVQSHLHEAMEDGTITVTKAAAGTLKARTAIFMIGNPKYGRYNPYDSVIDQIDLPKPLFNRFDLIFPIKDLPNADRDKELADAVLNKHMDIEKSNERPIQIRLFKNYLCYVSLNIKPKLSAEARKELSAYFLKLRNQSGNNGKGNVGITARQLDGLVRMAEASAKLHMRSEVTKKDALKAIELLNHSMQAFGIDPDSGKVDIDRISTGISASQRSKIVYLKDLINMLEDEYGQKIPIDKIYDRAEAEKMAHDETEKLLEKLQRTGDIFLADRRHISKVK